MPHSEFLAQNHIKTICTRVQFAADQCPKGSIYGYVTATTPLLEKPLEGPLYLRSSSHPLPDLVAALHGQIDVDLVGRIDSKNGGIRTTFDAVPDAPVSKFVLTMQGGKKGLLGKLQEPLRIDQQSRRQIHGAERQDGELDAGPDQLLQEGRQGRQGRQGKAQPHYRLAPSLGFEGSYCALYIKSEVRPLATPASPRRLG